MRVGIFIYKSGKGDGVKGCEFASVVVHVSSHDSTVFRRRVLNRTLDKRSNVVNRSCHCQFSCKSCVCPVVCVVYTTSLLASSRYGSKQMLAFKNTSLCNANASLSLNQPITAFTLKLSRKPPRSSFLTSTTQCSKLSILTLALVSWATSSNALPNRFFP